MSAIEGTPSHSVLKNRGVPVLVHQVEPTDDGLHWDRVFNEADEPVKVTTWVRFTNLSLAEVESTWGDFEGWQKALDERPYNTLLDTFAFIWEVPRAQAGKMMLDDAADDYSTAVGAAFMMSQGIEGDAVVRVIGRGVSAAKTLRERLEREGLAAVMEAEAEEDLAEAKRLAERRSEDAPATPTPPSPSPLGLPDSPTGPSWDAESTSSGD